jgi:uncharacterized membrane protein YdfJ with MMPL/SSD domain
MNFSMMIGLAVGIDYSLFIVSRSSAKPDEQGNTPGGILVDGREPPRQE